MYYVLKSTSNPILFASLRYSSQLVTVDLVQTFIKYLKPPGIAYKIELQYLNRKYKIYFTGKGFSPVFESEFALRSAKDLNPAIAHRSSYAMPCFTHIGWTKFTASDKLKPTLHQKVRTKTNCHVKL